MAYIIDIFQSLQTDLSVFKVCSEYVRRKVVIKFRKLFPDCYTAKPVHSVQILNKQLFVNGLWDILPRPSLSLKGFTEYMGLDGEV